MDMEEILREQDIAELIPRFWAKSNYVLRMFYTNVRSNNINCSK